MPHAINLIGREKEMEFLTGLLSGARSSNGSAVIISGEAGIGKTRILDELRDIASENFRILSGAAASDTIHPFLVLSNALQNELDSPLFEDVEYQGFAKIFAVNRAGLLVAEASPDQDDSLDSDIFAGMLSAVQNFVKDSLGSPEKQSAGLGRLEYGNMKILIEHGNHVFLTAVFQGQEHPDIKRQLKETLTAIEESHSEILENWKGNLKQVEGIQNIVDNLSRARFQVRRNMEGINLEDERLRIASKVLEKIIRLDNTSPLLLILEDLHWADLSSIQVFGHIARNISQDNVLLVGTTRLNRSKNLEELLSSLAESGAIETMNLERLGPEIIPMLTNSIYTINDFPPSLNERLVNQCEGNPFFVIEMLRHMADVGSIGKRNGTYVLLSDSMDMPDSVEEVVHRRLEALEPDAMMLAEYASCLGTVFETNTALSLEALKDPQQVLGTLTGARMIIRNNGTSEFSHAIFQDVIYRSIDPRWKSRYHRGLGNYYETAFKNKEEEVLYELARHFSRSNEYDKAFRYSMGAAERAEASFAADQAVEFYDVALEILPNVKEPMNKDEEIARIHLQKGEVLMLSGSWNQAEEVLGKCIELCTKLDDVQLIADSQNKYGEILCNRGNNEKALSLFMSALDHYNELNDEKMSMKALNNIGGLYCFQGDFAKALDYHNQELELARKLGDRIAESAAMKSMGTMETFKGNNEQALEWFMKTLHVYEEEIVKRGRPSVLSNIGTVHHGLGNYDEAMKYLTMALEAAQEIGDRQSLNYAVGNIGIIYFDMGEYEKAMEYLERDLAIAREMGNKYSACIALSNLGNLLKDMEEFDKAEENYDEAIAIAREINLNYLACFLSFRAELALAAGKSHEARQFNDEAQELAKTVNIPEFDFSMGIINAKVMGISNTKEAQRLIMELYNDELEPENQSTFFYEMFKITGSQEHREKALEMLKEVASKTPNVQYKKKIEELE